MPRMIAAASDSFIVEHVSWLGKRQALHAVRRAVFIEEQRVPEHLEWDEEDERACHVLATSLQGAPIGTGRLKQDCYIGRMAVLQAWRGRGVGRMILRTLLDIAQKQGCSVVRLHAQTHAIEFYARLGFSAFGEEFDEAGIPHRQMELRLAQAPR
jgi:predicted GNAT family N-acyltransferase